MPEFAVGEKVRIVLLPPYLKTADPMPMLRPQNILKVGDEGIVTGRNPGGTWSVRFEKGAYLLDSQYLEAIDS
ncbi:regulatory protein SipA [Baaleninema sp.]|uniref:regulatory protein SipA n=1 Tax=Baaleninema sp. TaxID=3101197 RepID=UPI003CFDC015